MITVENRGEVDVADGGASRSKRRREVFTDGHAPLVKARRIFRYLPSAPRCKVCNNPFGGRTRDLRGCAQPIAAFVLT